ncbi:reticulon-like protein B22 [Cinnamomum micranthum f. kanehirae]|uniref:Reticulon-like protein B22 n=1 Tax=Cinnamomum micranthum f. kanehirae TaxID=337451 RepID=A0A3S3NQK0_9MAGN|nr:reticulon-like protein B22 [Cinnamomum micranthum f. kanehirae]
MDCRSTEIGRPLVLLICGTLVYYHCAYRNSSLLSLVSDVFIVLLCSLAILGLLFRQMNISVPVDPLEWQISQDTANGFVACLANTIGAAESVLRVAATGHDKRLFLKFFTSTLLLNLGGITVIGTLLVTVRASLNKVFVKILEVCQLWPTSDLLECSNREVGNLLDEELFLTSKLESPQHGCLPRYDPFQISILKEKGGISKRNQLERKGKLEEKLEERGERGKELLLWA